MKRSSEEYRRPNGHPKSVGRAVSRSCTRARGGQRSAVLKRSLPHTHAWLKVDEATRSGLICIRMDVVTFGC